MSDNDGGTEPARKKSKSAVIESKEKLELEGSTGLGQKYVGSIIGISSILLGTVWILLLLGVLGRSLGYVTTSQWILQKPTLAGL
jgi:hypothetical protein